MIFNVKFIRHPILNYIKFILSVIDDPEFSDKEWEPGDHEDGDSSADDGYQQIALGMYLFVCDTNHYKPDQIQKKTEKEKQGLLFGSSKLFSPAILQSLFIPVV